jgi:hypothetical protein
LESPFLKNEMGGLLRARHKACNSGRRGIWYIIRDSDSGRFADAFRPLWRVLYMDFPSKPFHIFKKGLSNAKECLLDINAKSWPEIAEFSTLFTGSNIDPFQLRFDIIYLRL